MLFILCIFKLPTKFKPEVRVETNFVIADGILPSALVCTLSLVKDNRLDEQIYVKLFGTSVHENLVQWGYFYIVLGIQKSLF